jgi:hypothetical protein
VKDICAQYKELVGLWSDIDRRELVVQVANLQMSVLNNAYDFHWAAVRVCKSF